jgi:DNA sulfur modification protein DndE
VSARSQNLLAILKRKTGLTPNILARFAICLSLKDRSIPNAEEFDEKGSEFSPTVLFGEHEKMFMALMLTRLHKDRLDPSLYLQKMTRAHLNRGVIALYPRINDLSDFYELIKEEKL